MSKQGCIVCKIVGIIAIIGALNWGLVGVFGFNLVETIFGVETALTRVVYAVVGIAGILLLGGLLGLCSCCKKT